MSESFKRVRRFTEIRSANYRSRPGVIETVHEYVGADAVAHVLTEHDLEQVVAEHAALLVEVEQRREEVAVLRATWNDYLREIEAAPQRSVGDRKAER